MSIEEKSAELMKPLADYIGRFDLPKSIFKFPDHVALPAEDITGFSNLVKDLEPKSEQRVLTETDPRFVVAARLKGGLVVDRLGTVQWVEITESLPLEILSEAEAAHVEFYYPEFGEVRKLLDWRRIDYSIDQEPIPQIKITYNQHGDELRFTKMPIRAIVANGLKTDEFKLL